MNNGLSMDSKSRYPVIAFHGVPDGWPGLVDQPRCRIFRVWQRCLWRLICEISECRAEEQEIDDQVLQSPGKW